MPTIPTMLILKDMATSYWAHVTPRGISLHSILAAALGLAWLLGPPLEAQDTAARSLENCFGVGKTVEGRRVGPETCRITEEIRIANVHGVAYRRIEMGISGSIEGYTVKNGPRIVNFTDVPELAMGQKGHLGPYFHGVGGYRSELGSGMTLFIPESSEDWNGKLFVLVHGGTRPYQPVGKLVPRTPDQFNPLTGANHYAGLMIDKGYAVAHTLRLVTSSRLSDAAGHGQPVTLDDGSILQGAGYLASSELSSQNLDLGGVFDALIDALNLWVDQGVEPPAGSFDSGSDRPEGEEHTVIRLPEVACPTGIYYEFPRASSGSA